MSLWLFLILLRLIGYIYKRKESMFYYSNIHPSRLTKKEAQEEIDDLVRQKRGRRMAFYVHDGSSQRYWLLRNRVDGLIPDHMWWEFWK